MSIQDAPAQVAHNGSSNLDVLKGSAPQPDLTRGRAGITDWLTPILIGIFAVSGASGLIYQIAWVRLLSLTFGVTIYAVSVVVATFMAGLALGSFLGGRLADRVRIPVLWYGAIEFAIAVLGAKSVDALDWVQATYVTLQPRDADQAVAEIVALRFLLAGAVILV